MTLISSPEARTWSRPPKPISYAQPSPPNTQTDFLERYSLCLRISCALSQPQASRAAISSSGSSLVLFAVVDGVQIFLASSLNSLVAAVLDQVANLLDQAVTNNLLAQVHTEAVLPRCPRTGRFAQAGPWPCALTVYGEVAAGPPQMEEQPVALEMYILSPNSWVIRRA